jgi:hypothetical protein
MSNHSIPPAGPDDWDSLIDNPFNIGPFSRSTKADDWWVITGMHVKLPEALPPRQSRPGIWKLLVLADTISIGTPGAIEINLDGWSDVLLIGDTINRYNDCEFYRNLHDPKETFRVAFLGRTWERIPPVDTHFFIRIQGGRERGRSVISISRWLERDFRRSVQIEFYSAPDYDPVIGRFRTRELPLPNSGPHFDACRPFLERLLLTAQSLFNANRTADAHHLLGRLETLLAMNPSVASWQELAPQIAATREMLQPQLPGSDRVPYLSPDVYGGVAGAYRPALTAFAATFQEFVNRAGEIEQRKRAARLILDERADAIRFQALVTKQLTDNLKIATDAVARAQTSMESQSGRVEGAAKAFRAGLDKWKKEQESKAAWAIAGAVFSFVGSVGKMLAGNPAGAAGAAQAIAKVPTTAQKLVELMKKIAKIVALVAAVVKMCRAIVDAAGRISDAKEFASLMANVRREAEAGLDEAPSANAQWDQLWLEVETALAPAVAEDVPGAQGYLKELKVMIIYGRTLTAAQAAIPPIAQELAQASLLAELAARQREALAKEIETLQAEKPASAMAVVALWLRHRSVQRAMFTALQDFDAAHRYWALTDERPPRHPSRSITDLADDLLAVADIKASLQRALASFDPKPQDFTRVRFNVPDTAVADFLRDGSFALRFTPDFSPVANWGNVGRVRVDEVAAWVIWNEGKRPEQGYMEFTIKTDGDYYDQRVEGDEVKRFRFIGARVNLTFRYDPVEADRSREQSIAIRGKVAEDFRAFYTEPTLFTEWQFSLPNGGGTLDREALQGAVSGIRLEFSGKYIKDADRLLDDDEE